MTTSPARDVDRLKIGVRATRVEKSAIGIVTTGLKPAHIDELTVIEPNDSHQAELTTVYRLTLLSQFPAVLVNAMTS